MNKKIRQNCGFTLVEVIISIAVLSILCIIFLQLFVKAKDISDRSSEIDQSVRLITSHLDSIKGFGSLTRITSSKEFAWMEKKVDGDTFGLSGYLNSEFEETQESDAPYLLSIDVVLDKETEKQGSGQTKLYRITARVYDTTKHSSEEWIYSAETLAILEE